MPHLILDGLQDAAVGRALSRAWLAAGFANGVDVSGQAGWVHYSGAPSRQGGARATVDFAKPPFGSEPQGRRKAAEMVESDVDRAAAVARRFGLEVRDRVGNTFRADVALAALRQQVVYEYKSRLATALTFGLPALGLHYLGPRLAGGTGDRASMLLPWIIELLLVGWTCIAAGWPILWQGALAVRGLRCSADVLTSVIVIGAMAWSVAAIAGAGGAPMLHVVVFAIVLAVLQRWLGHRFAARISGRADLLVPHFHRVVFLWLAASVALALLHDVEAGLASALLFPPMIGLGAVNRRTPGASMLLPVFAFAFVLLLGPGAMNLRVEGARVEIAAGFSLLMTAVMAAGWRGMTNNE